MADVPEQLAEFVLDARYGDLEAVEEGLKSGVEAGHVAFPLSAPKRAGFGLEKL